MAGRRDWADSTNDAYMTPSQAARVLGVSHMTVNHWMDKGRLVGQRTPLGRILDVASVMALLQQRRAAQDVTLRTLDVQLQGIRELRWNG